MQITTITAVRLSEENTDVDGIVCGSTSWWEYSLPSMPGNEPETFFMSEAWCVLCDVYGLTSRQATDVLRYVQDCGRVDLAV